MSASSKRKGAESGYPHSICPCGGQPVGTLYRACCGRLLDDAIAAPDAAALMRSRYTAYARHDYEYLRRTWHPDTCPGDLGKDAEQSEVHWLGLTIKRHDAHDPDHAEVEFVARYKIGGRAYRLHEISRFVRQAGLWLYVDGDVRES